MSLLLLLAAMQLHIAIGIVADILRDRFISGRDRIMARDIRHKVSSMCVSCVVRQLAIYSDSLTKICSHVQPSLPIIIVIAAPLCRVFV